MKLKFLGTGNAFSKTKGPSCAVFSDGAFEILIDTGEGVSPLVEKAIEQGVLTKYKNVLNIAITHMHPDHVAGLGNLLYLLRYKYDVKHVNIFLGCEEHVTQIKNLLSIYDVDNRKVHGIFIHTFVCNTYTTISSSTTLRGARKLVTETEMRMVPVEHDGRPCFGLIFVRNGYYENIVPKSTDKSEHISRTIIAYSGDTNEFFGNKLKELLIGVSHIACDIAVYHEASTIVAPLHTTLHELVKAWITFKAEYADSVSELYVYHVHDSMRTTQDLIRFVSVKFNPNKIDTDSVYLAESVILKEE